MAVSKPTFLCYLATTFHGLSCRRLTVFTVRQTELLQEPIIRVERMIMGYKSIVFPLNYIGLAGRVGHHPFSHCYGSLFFTAETPQLKLCKLMVRLELTITVLQTVPLTSWVHEHVRFI